MQNIGHFSLLKDLFSSHMWVGCYFAFMAPRITEEAKGISVQPVYMLESGCNPEPFQAINILVVFSALQQDLTQLRLIRFLQLEIMRLRISHIFNKAKCLSGSYMHRSISCIKSISPVPQLPFWKAGQHLALSGCSGKSVNGSCAASKHDMWIILRPWWLQLGCSYSNRSVVLVLEESWSLGEGKAEMQTMSQLG